MVIASENNHKNRNTHSKTTREMSSLQWTFFITWVSFHAKFDWYNFIKCSGAPFHICRSNLQINAKLNWSVANVKFSRINRRTCCLGQTRSTQKTMAQTPYVVCIKIDTFVQCIACNPISYLDNAQVYIVIIEDIFVNGVPLGSLFCFMFDIHFQLLNCHCNTHCKTFYSSTIQS